MRYLMLGVSVAVAMVGLGAAAMAQDEASLRAADVEQTRIIDDQDVAAQQDFMHDNYMINAPANRVMRKARMIELLADGALRRESVERTIEGIQITDDVGIVMGRETVTPSPGSQLGTQFGTVPLHRRFTNVFLFRDGRWRFLARQATVVGSVDPR